MAHKKGGGSSRNGRDSGGQRRGTKIYDGEQVKAGMIIIRQLGTRIHAGENVGVGRDFTLYATAPGYVKYEFIAQGKRRVSVYPQRAGERTAQKGQPEEHAAA